MRHRLDLTAGVEAIRVGSASYGTNQFTLVTPLDFSAQQRYSGGDVPVWDGLARSSSDEQRAAAGDRSNAWVVWIAPTRTDHETATPWSVATAGGSDRDRSTIPNNVNWATRARGAAQSGSFSFVLVWVGAPGSELVGAGQR
jgi:hypothetical protein